MLSEAQKVAITRREVTFETSRSGGKGGQNVNKVETRVVAVFDVLASDTLTLQQKQALCSKISLLTEERYIRVQESRDRSQLANKRLAIEKLFFLIDKALKPKKKRVATRPSRASKERKLEQKKRRSEVKKHRRKDF